MATPIDVVCDEDLEPLMPTYLKNRENDVAALVDEARSGDFAAARQRGHGMKGSGGGYGFDRITELGAAIEDAAKASDGATIEALAAELGDYLSRLTIRYEPMD